MTVDATRPLDTEPVLDWLDCIRLIAALANANEAAIGGEYKPVVSPANTSATISTFNKVYTVNSPNPVTLTLATAQTVNIGEFLEIHKLGVGNLTIIAGGSDTIADGEAGTSITNSIAAEAKEANVILRCVAVGQWMIHSMLGTWA